MTKLIKYRVFTRQSTIFLNSYTYLDATPVKANTNEERSRITIIDWDNISAGNKTAITTALNNQGYQFDHDFSGQ